MIIHLTPKKHNDKVIPITSVAGSARWRTEAIPAGRESEVEESIEFIKISRLRPSVDGLRSK